MKNIIDISKKTNEVHEKRTFNGDYTEIKGKFQRSFYGLNNVEEELRDLRYVGENFIQNTSELNNILMKIQEEKPYLFEIKKHDFEVESGINLVTSHFLPDDIHGLNNLLKNKDYRKEFDKLYSEKAVDKHPNDPISIDFLENAKNIQSLFHNCKTSFTLSLIKNND